MILLPNDLAPNRTSRGFAAFITVITVLGLLYFGVLGLADPNALVPGGGAEAAETFAGYMAVRNLVMAAASLLLLVLRLWRGLALLLILNGVVQAFDALLGAARHDVAAALSPAIIAVALFVAAAALLRSDRSEATGQPVR